MVRPGAYPKFPDLNLLLGKHVLIQGAFIAYHGSPEVELTDPSQVKIILGK